MIRTKPLLIILINLLFVVGCVSSSKDRLEDAKITAKSSLPAAPATWKSAQESVGEVQIGWLARLNDPILEELVEEAQNNNSNLELAAANVDNAKALSIQASAGLLPQLRLQSGALSTGTRDVTAPSRISLGLQSSWEIDLWGRLRAGQQASYQSLAAAEADYTFAQYSIAASVAQAYLASIEAKGQLEIAQKTIAALEQTNNIVQVQFANGTTDEQSVALARSDLAAAKEGLAASQGAQRNAIRSLELLLGRYPQAELEVAGKLPVQPESVPAGIPSTLLERRPDLISAERRIAAAFNQLDQAKTARLPAISLSGSLGGASNSLGTLLDPANVAWQTAANLLAPLFDGGIIQAQIDAANANQKAAIASYRQAALSAFAEVETALDQEQVLQQRLTSLRVSKSSAEEALRIAELQYKEGEISLVDVLTIQQRVFSARQRLLSIERAALSQWVDLNLALGGSWK